MTAESHEPGFVTVVVPIGEARKLVKGQTASIEDASGDPVRGVVETVKEGNRMAVVIVKVADV